MKIVNVILSTNLGGMEQASLRLMRGLKERGHSFEVVSLNPVGLMGSLLKECEIPVIGLPYLGKWGWRSFLTLRRTLRSIEAEALIMTGSNLLAMLALGNLCRGRRLLTIRNCHAGGMSPWQWRLIYRVACRCFQAIFYPSDYVRIEAETLYPPVKALSRTVYSPLAIPRLPSKEDREKARIALGLPSDVPVIGNSGWLIPDKRFDIFLKVAHKVLRDVPTAWFLIAGDGEERANLESLARELNIADRVKWLGWQKNMTQFYSSLDVMLFNSDSDAMPQSVVEALSYGIPLVASVLLGGLNEIVSSNDYGFLIPVHDISALSEKTVYLIKNKEEGRKIALSGRDRVSQLLNPCPIIDTVESLLLRNKDSSLCRHAGDVSL